jgi:hypothetical protein
MAENEQGQKFYSKIAATWAKQTGKRIARIEDMPSDLKSQIIIYQKEMATDAVPDPKDVEQYDQYVKQQMLRVLYAKYYDYMQQPWERNKLLQEYSIMAEDDILNSALDIYAEESSTDDDQGNCIQISSDSLRVKNILEKLFFETLDINSNAPIWVRNMCTYGDNYLFMEISKKKGVMDIEQLPVEEITREEGYDLENVQAVRFLWNPGNNLSTQYTMVASSPLSMIGEKGIYFDDWQIAHMRYVTSQANLPYGRSILEPVRKVWKQLSIMEDAMIIYRITRAPERRIFYVDVGNIDPADVSSFMTMVKQEMKKAPLVNTLTGNKDLRYNPMSPDEDFWIPTRGDKSSRVEQLPGASNMDEIADIEYLQNKLFAGLKIPKSFLTFEEELSNKAALGSEDIRFARSINRVQQVAIKAFIKIAGVHLISRGLEDEVGNFEIQMTNPSSISEQEKLDIIDKRAGVASSLWSPDGMSLTSYVDVQRQVFQKSDSEIKTVIRQQWQEAALKKRIEEAGEPDIEDTGAVGDEVFGKEAPPQPGGQDQPEPNVGDDGEDKPFAKFGDNEEESEDKPFAKFEFDKKDKRLVECERLDRKVDDTFDKVDELLSEIEER